MFGLKIKFKLCSSPEIEKYTNEKDLMQASRTNNALNFFSFLHSLPRLAKRKEEAGCRKEIGRNGLLTFFVLCLRSPMEGSVALSIDSFRQVKSRPDGLKQFAALQPLICLELK